MRKNDTIKFGPGYRTFTPVRSVATCPVCASSEPDIVAEILPTEQFRIEKNGEDDDLNKFIRIRSDVSILLHAADMAKKFGTSTMQSFVDSKRPKFSNIQSQMDDLTDAQILATVKSRHIQSPSELLSWSEHLTEIANKLELEAAEKFAAEQEKAAAEAAKLAEQAADTGTQSVTETSE